MMILVFVESHGRRALPQALAFARASARSFRRSRSTPRRCTRRRVGAERSSTRWRARPAAVIAPGTDRGNEVLAHVAAQLDQPMAANCVVGHARRSGEGHPRSLGRQPARGGAAARLAPAAHRRAARGRGGRRSAVEVELLVTAARAPAVIACPSGSTATAAGVSLADADVVVSGGRGVGSAEGFAVIEELAELLGGAVGCSRAVTSAGWRPHTDQVGQTGTKISPEIYIACGISGATQHMAGCKGAKKLLAINPDGEASIFAERRLRRDRRSARGRTRDLGRDPEGEARIASLLGRARARRRGRGQRDAVRAPRAAPGRPGASGTARRRARGDVPRRVHNETTVILGQRKLLQRVVPGLLTLSSSGVSSCCCRRS